MNNGDLPIAPVLDDWENFVLFMDGIKGGRNYGLTKREHFAVSVIAPSEVLCKALIAQYPKGYTTDQYIETVVMYKVREADALLKELDK